MVRRIRNVTETFDLTEFSATTIDEAMKLFAGHAVMSKNHAVQKYKPSKVTTFVGEQEGRSEFTVKPGETIRYELDYLKSIVAEAHRLLRLNSPVQTGPDSWGQPPDDYKYIDQHYIFDGKRYVDDPEEIDDDATEVVLVNVAPYARKVEIHGWKGTQRFTAPYHTYEMTVQQMKKYANVVTIKYTFWHVSGFEVGRDAAHRLRSRREASARYPAMIISLR